ncbi:precorrin-6y C5,15-methyltransferase (decarboxylating) subunit CbiE [Corynebacterium sp. HS2168-gen11]|uniref:precorrin-6y C5,15-methyltransferase (decarboxylating) subunit CbiE n=1 Tax=Corynebacterium sp. HS2168-gen11 TaxID=2974027 RepID=UPI00216B00EE|nr:precorrin-6y C5,15-methyltransferase (decarboxylating) subunit CbiE [Corynebacterium sp. HS2168-gen11]MCS4535071.1 precorrin-6y C5,15-methyltransferase (decarboxylating) subunit CbiE [Corynebacterium sp. HS2168-gen11]
MTKAQVTVLYDVGDATAAADSVSVIGISAQGMSELGQAAKTALFHADVILGSWRQLNLISDDVPGERRPWTSPLLPALSKVFAELEGKRIAVLTSGDPMFHGIGALLKRKLPHKQVVIYSHVSSASLACARLGWQLERTPVYSLVNAVVETLVLAIESGQRFLVLGRDEKTPLEICELLVHMGQPQAQVEILSDLGSSDETIASGHAAKPPVVVSALNVIAVTPEYATLSRAPGLPDDCYDHDEYILPSHIRAVAIAALAPREQEVIWVIGGGAGSIAIEALRTTHTTRAVVFEQDQLRQARILKNSRNLGVCHRIAIQGSAPEKYIDVPDSPEKIFIGGGLTCDGVFEGAWERLQPGGRLVVHATTAETEQFIWELHAIFGGMITKFEIAHTQQIGAFHTLQPDVPVTQWVVEKSSLTHHSERPQP